MKKYFTILLVTLIAAFLFVSCAYEPVDETATLRISITNDRARTISSEEESIKITKYKIYLSRGTSGEKGQIDYETVSKSYTKEFERNSNGVYSIDKILPGGYKIYAEAISSDGTVVGVSDTVQTFLKRGETSYSLTIDALKGKQTAVLTYTWDISSFDSSPVFDLEITDQSGKAVSYDKSAINTSTSGQAVVTLSLDAGSYIFNAYLKDSASSNVSYACYTEVVRFTNSSTENITATMNFAEFSQVQSKATITTNISEPVVATLNVSASKGGFTATINFTGLPHGTTASDVTISWMVDGRVWDVTTGEGKFVIADMDGGEYRITAVMKCSSLTGSMGSVSSMVTVE